MVEYVGIRWGGCKAVEQTETSAMPFEDPAYLTGDESELELVADTEHMEVGIAVVLVLTVLV